VEPTLQLGWFDLGPVPAPANRNRARHTDETDHAGDSQDLPEGHSRTLVVPYLVPAMAPKIGFDEAASTTSSGDVWLFRGSTPADRAIRLFTNSPVNHVSMVLALEDLPPLLWHAELAGRIPDVWHGTKQRGAQLHQLAHAASVWHHRYGQRVWMRHISTEVTPEMEDLALSVVEEYSGRAFPGSVSLASRWLKGRIRRGVPLSDLYCAELVAVTYERMGLLEANRPANWYDPGKFWSGDRLPLLGATLGPEQEVVDIPPPDERWFDG
jgi:hypothetical protein